MLSASFLRGVDALDPEDSIGSCPFSSLERTAAKKDSAGVVGILLPKIGILSTTIGNQHREGRGPYQSHVRS